MSETSLLLFQQLKQLTRLIAKIKDKARSALTIDKENIRFLKPGIFNPFVLKRKI